MKFQRTSVKIMLLLILSFSALTAVEYRTKRTKASERLGDEVVTVSSLTQWIKDHKKIVISTVIAFLTGSILVFAYFVLKKKKEEVTEKDKLLEKSVGKSKQSSQVGASNLRNALDGIQDLDYKVDNPNGLKAKTKEGLHMVLVYRDACPYCTRFFPNYEKIYDYYEGKAITFSRVKLEDDISIKQAQKEYIKQHYQAATTGEGLYIATFPCLLIILKGKIVKVLQGNSKERELNKLKALINTYLVQLKNTK